MTPEDEDLGWARVRAAWADDAAHRAWLAGFTDLDGLARAGRRYQAVLAAQPDDPVAVRWRAEILKRATAAGLASLPRTPPPPAVPRWVRVAIVGLLSTAAAWGLWWVIGALLELARKR
jgi:hypothetical protein